MYAARHVCPSLWFGRSTNRLRQDNIMSHTPGKWALAGGWLPTLLHGALLWLRLAARRIQCGPTSCTVQRTSAALLPLSRSYDRVEDICISTHRLNRALCYRGGYKRTPSHNTRTDDERTEYIVRSTRTETPMQGAGGRANRNRARHEAVHAVLLEKREVGSMQSPQSTSRYTLAPVHCRSTATTDSNNAQKTPPPPIDMWGRTHPHGEFRAHSQRPATPAQHACPIHVSIYVHAKLQCGGIGGGDSGGGGVFLFRAGHGGGRGSPPACTEHAGVSGCALVAPGCATGKPGGR